MKNFYPAFDLSQKPQSKAQRVEVLRVKIDKTAQVKIERPKFKPKITAQNAEIQTPKQPLPKVAFYCEPEKRTVRQMAETDRLLDGLEREYLQREAQPQRAETTRLVNTLQSPTDSKSVNSRETIARIYHREWSGEYRFSVDSFTRLQKAPEPVQGDRMTKGLTAGAARKIKDAGAYVAACKGGFSTFLTLTFDAPARARIQDVVIMPENLGFKGQRIGNHYADGLFCDLKQGAEIVRAAGEWCNGEQAAGDFVAVEFDTASTIGKETSRFFDGLQKKYSRGWVWEPTKEELEKDYKGFRVQEHIEGKEEKINYIWVAENPDRYSDKPNINGVGEPIKHKLGKNPHVHVLLDWSVPQYQFLGWAKQLESLWGQGFSNLKKIKDAKAATGYLIKALGYMTKGAHEVDPKTGELVNSQGIIKGNRYNISREARAPDWECLGEFQADNMGQIIRQIGGQIEHEQARIREELKQTARQQAETAKKLAIVQNYKNIPETIKSAKIARLTRQIERDKQQQKSLRAWRETNAHGGKYKITFRNKSQLDSFIDYAITKRGWTPLISKYTKVARDEIKTISTRAKAKAEQIIQTINDKFFDFENYINQVLFDVDRRYGPEINDF